MGSGCQWFYPTKVPIEQHFYEAPTPEKTSHLIVFLPGRHDRATKYEEEGWIQSLWEHRFNVDAVAVEAHLGYYLKKTILERLKQDVILPAQAKGYNAIWMVGISMGGIGTLGYPTVYPGDIDGMVAFAPYLGESALIEEIEQAGGLAHWTPEVSDKDPFRKLWLWLKQYDAAQPQTPPLYLGYGREDSFFRAHALLQNVVPADHVFLEEGGHKWVVWNVLWEKLLNASAFAEHFPRFE